VYISEAGFGPYIVSRCWRHDWIESSQPKLDVVFKLVPYHAQNMSYDRYPGIHSRGLHALLFDPCIYTVEVV